METQKPESKNMFVYLDDDGWFEPNDLASSDAISPLRAALREQLRGEAQEVQEPSVRSLLRPVAAGPENRAEILERAPAEAEETRGLREQVLQEQREQAGWVLSGIGSLSVAPLRLAGQEEPPFEK